jgi:hypothetical protein
MKLDLSDLIDAIAEAVVTKLKEEGATVNGAAEEAAPKTTKDKPAGKPAGKPAAGKGKAAKDKPDRDAIYEKVKELGDRDGKPAARALIQEYAPTFGEVSDDDLPKLLADVEAKLEEEGDL